MTSPQSLEQIAACISGYDPHALPVAHAQAFIARLVPQVKAVEMCALREALGRTLARDVVSHLNVPAHDNSAMDGYALRGAELLTDQPTRLRMVGLGLAGQQFDGSVPAGACVRITTGAVMPPGLDTVVPQEFTRSDSAGFVSIPAKVLRAGDNRRLAGEDLARGDAALSAGRRLRPADLGLLASLDGRGPQRLDGDPDGRRLVAGPARSGSDAEHDPAWLLFGPDGRLPIDGSLRPLLRHVPDGRTVQLDEVSR